VATDARRKTEAGVKKSEPPPFFTRPASTTVKAMPSTFPQQKRRPEDA